MTTNPNRTVDRTGLVWQTNSRGHAKIVGEIHESKAGKFKVVMVGTAVARSIKVYLEAKDIALAWEPTDDQATAILNTILEG